MTCAWCDLDTFSPDVPCVCHPANCGCHNCKTARYWAYLAAGPEAWTHPEREFDRPVPSPPPKEPTHG